MSDLAVKLTDVRKSFRRFRHPGWRALDALGVKVPQSRYDIFCALNNVSINISKGERVALIGRNGAGKSTTLRVISGQVRPDSGSLTVNGKVQALMELGTGFHPEFSGLDNIKSSLALQGVFGKDLRLKIDEIEEFTELHDFLHRPVREYSAGMYARLAFAVATTVAPEILIVDEILGAGDAYFVGKSIQRMRNLTESGATILFVSHDMGSVQMLCDRAIWIDRGVVCQDGPILQVSKAYLASVREDEEIRVRARHMSLTKRQATKLGSTERNLLFRFVGVDGKPPQKPFLVSSLSLGSGDSLQCVIRPDGPIYDGNGPIIDSVHMNWRGPSSATGTNCWTFADFGGSYGHAPWQMPYYSTCPSDPWIEIEFLPSESGGVLVEQYDSATDAYVTLAKIEAGRGEKWNRMRIPALPPSNKTQNSVVDLLPLDRNDRYGSTEVAITGFAFVDAKGVSRHTLLTGDNACAIMSYSAEKRVVAPVAVIAIYRPDGTCAMQVLSNVEDGEFGVIDGSGIIKVKFEPLNLGPGEYIVSVAMFKELNLASRAEPEAYDLHDRCYALKVLPPPGIGVEIGIVNQKAIWELIADG